MRRTMRQRMSSLDDGARQAAGEGIALRLRESARWSRIATVFSFLSTREEVDTGPIHRLVLADGKILALPRITPDGLRFHRVERPGAIRSKNRFGIREPSARLPSVACDDRTLILVPGVAFDREGGRLGRGGAFYDRFLAAATGARTIGICHSAQLVDYVPTGPMDVAVQWVATERDIFKAGK